MREGLIRVLEKEIDTTVLKREEGMASFKQDDGEAENQEMMTKERPEQNRSNMNEIQLGG